MHYAIRGRLRRLALRPVFSFRTSLGSPSPLLQPCSSHLLLIPQSHQACFLEDAISSTSTHEAGALCCSCSRRATDQVCHLLPGSTSPSLCTSIITLLLQSPQAAKHNLTHKQTLPTSKHSAKHTFLSSFHLCRCPRCSPSNSAHAFDRTGFRGALNRTAPADTHIRCLQAQEKGTCEHTEMHTSKLCGTRGPSGEVDG